MRAVLTLLVAITLLFSLPAVAGNPGKSRSGKQSKAVQVQTSKSAGVEIAVGESEVIFKYLRSHRDAPPPAFKNTKPLPPGVAKKIARGGTLPPGIAMRSFPADLSRQLPSRPGEEWLVIGNDIVLVKVSTKTIVDVLKDVFEG